LEKIVVTFFGDAMVMTSLK